MGNVVTSLAVVGPDGVPRPGTDRLFTPPDHLDRPALRRPVLRVCAAWLAGHQFSAKQADLLAGQARAPGRGVTVILPTGFSGVRVTGARSRGDR